jgi:phosphoribosylamine--glycine ligase
VVVVVAAAGYPDSTVTGEKIKILDPERAVVTRPDQPDPGTGAYLLHAGTATDAAGDLVSAGGRVLNAVGWGRDVAAARAAAYDLAAAVDMPDGWYRRDIAAGI